MNARAHDWKLPAFLLLAPLILLTEFAVLQTLPGLDHAELVAAGATLDLMVVLPLLFYFLVARPRQWGAIALVPVLVFCALAARLLLPAKHQGTLHGFELMLPLAELALVAFVVIRAREALRVFRKEWQAGSDVLAAGRRATAAVAGTNRGVEIVAFELAMLYYALGTWGRPQEAPGAAAAFTVHQRSGYGQLLAGLGMVGAIELVLAHWLVQQYWSPLAAWVLTIVSLYGMLFFLADWQACRRRPVLLAENQLRIRIGLRWDLDIPYEIIRAFRRTTRAERAKGPTTLKAVVHGQPDFLLELERPITALGAYGRRRQVDRVYLQVDAKADFEEALRARIAAI